MLYLGNAFSLNMLRLHPETPTLDLQVVGLTNFEVAVWLKAEAFGSIVGHADTAALFGELLGVEVVFNRASITLEQGDHLIVGQYRGPRLPEGVKVLPEGSKVEWAVISVL